MLFNDVQPANIPELILAVPSGRVTVAKVSCPLKTSDVVAVLAKLNGIFILLNLVPANAVAEIALTESGKTISCIAQFANALLDNVTRTLLPSSSCSNVTSVKDTQSLNALVFIVVTDFGMVTEVKPLPWKAN